MIGLSTPQRPLNRRVRKHCASISTITPVFLPYVDYGLAHKECHLNVRYQVKQHGGKVVNGWMIWDGDFFTEAEFHCVWRSPDGHLEDITPRVDGETEILFLPDYGTKLVRGPNGGVMCPCNRTTIPGHPYVWSGAPHPRSTIENGFHETVRVYAAGLGLDAFCICEGGN